MQSDRSLVHRRRVSRPQSRLVLFIPASFDFNYRILCLFKNVLYVIFNTLWVFRCIV